MMIAQLRRELAELLADRRLVLLLAALALATLAAGVTGGVREAEAARDRAAAERASYELWLGQGERNPHSAAHFGLHVMRPVSAAAAFDPGLSAFAGVSLWIEAHKQNSAHFRAAQDATALARYPQLSPAFLLQVIAPLAALLIGFASVAADRERGRLRFVLGQGVRPGAWLLAKALAVALALALCLAPLVLALLAGVTRAPVATLLGLGAAYGMYLLVFCLLAVAASALARRPAAALAALVAFWAFACVLAPRLATGLAGWMEPAPPGYAFRDELQRERKLAEQRLFPEEGISEHEKKTLAAHGVRHRDQLPFSMRGELLAREEEAGNEVFDRHYGALWRTWRHQASWALAAAVLSPQLALARASMGFAGTGLETELTFLAAAEQYRRSVQTLLNEDVRVSAVGKEYEYRAGRALWQRVPAFGDPRPPPAAAWRDQAPALAILALWCALACALLAAAARRLGGR